MSIQQSDSDAARALAFATDRPTYNDVDRFHWRLAVHSRPLSEGGVRRSYEHAIYALAYRLDAS